PARPPLPAPFPGCCRRSSSTGSTTWTGDWSTASRSAGRSRSVPTGSTCCTSGGAAARRARGATLVYVGDGRRCGRPRRPPARPWEVAQVAFEIARRHRFAADLAALPPDVTLHVLPTGEEARPSAGDLRNLRYRNLSGVPDRIDRAYAAAGAYLARSGASEDGGA